MPCAGEMTAISTNLKPAKSVGSRGMCFESAQRCVHPEISFTPACNLQASVEEPMQHAKQRSCALCCGNTCSYSAHRVWARSHRRPPSATPPSSPTPYTHARTRDPCPGKWDTTAFCQASSFRGLPGRWKPRPPSDSFVLPALQSQEE